MAVVKHIVLLKFKASAREDQIREVFEKLRGLQSLVPGIVDFTSGPNSSTEGLNRALTHGFIMTFKDAAARDGYLPHPDHERVKNDILPLVEDIVVFDFEV